ncbi:MAG: multiprotein-bridging factor 1 family protein [Candidatus Diapherotrites archaeon]|nr:TIGR00270 family protein [Candidatus Micrarchaeota archaeon]MBU1939824.1 TIGR00270 family protein [Candidatus Micrarchaeota archaeon]
MQCEICGKGTAIARIELDGSELAACPDCAGFGEKKGAIEDEYLNRAQVAKKATSPANSENSGTGISQSRSAGMESAAGLLDENLGTIIRRAREKKGLTIKELSEKVFEKESVLHKIEQNKALPDTRLQTRLESFLGIKINSADEGGENLKYGDLLRR